MARYLIGPITDTFPVEALAHSQDYLLFDFEGKQPLSIETDGCWDDLLAQLPERERPEYLVLWLPYLSIPWRLWEAPLPIVGLAPDWNLLWNCYQQILPRCDVAFTDRPGVKRFKQAGLANVREANLFGLEKKFPEVAIAVERERDIDVLFVGNVSASAQRERLTWLGRLAGLAARWKVEIQANVFGADYRQLLGRSKIVFNRSVRGECNKRVFEAIAGGALLLQESDNQEVQRYLRPGSEYVPYDAGNLEAVIEHYLAHEQERRTIATAAQARLPDLTFAALLHKALATLEPERDVLLERARIRAAQNHLPQLAAGVWSAAAGGTIQEMIEAMAQGPPSAAKRNAAGLFASGPHESVALFTEALDLEPHNIMIGLNRAEALARAGLTSEAIAQARLTLGLLDREDELEDSALDGPAFPLGFTSFRVEWEKACWSNAGAPDAEITAKRELVRAWLHSLLAELTGELNHFWGSVLARPDLAEVQAALGCALARAARFDEAILPLRNAVTANPFDRQAARAYYGVLNETGDWVGRANFAHQQLSLHKAAPAIVPSEEWFGEPPLSGRERSSIIVLACDEVEYTRQCVGSVLRNTAGDYELIFVDNGSTDGTGAYLEELRSSVGERAQGPARVEVIRNETNVGFPAGVNQGLAAAQGEFIVLLNNDTVVTPGWLAGLIGSSLRDWPRIGMVGPTSNYAPAPQLVHADYTELAGLDAFAQGRQRQFAGKAIATPRLTGFCLLIRRAVLEAVGGTLDERYGIGFFEDDDLCLRVRRAGYQLIAAQDVYIHHFGSRTFAGKGIDTAGQLDSNLERYREKWGEEEASAYRLPGTVANPEANESHDSARPRQKVSLCMIVRNEETNLADCIGPLREHVHEIIVVDTGSIDRTKELATALGAKVFEFPWIDDFSAARNESMKHASGGWIFWMDADDRIHPDNIAKLRRLFDSLDERNRAFVLKCVCVAAAPGETATEVDHVRLFRNDPRHIWKYKVHEQILGSLRSTNAEVEWPGVIIHHIGYVDPALRRHKLERDLNILETELRLQRDEPFILFNVGAIYHELRRPSEALDAMQRSLARSNPGDSIVRKLYMLIAQCQQELGRPAEALQSCVEGRKYYPDDAELLLKESGLRHEQGDLAGAEACLVRCIHAKESSHFGSVPNGVRGFRARYRLAMVYLEQHRYSEAEAQCLAALIEEPAFLPGHALLCEVHLQCREWTKLDESAGALSKLGEHGEEEAEIIRGRGRLVRNEFVAARNCFHENMQRFPQSIRLRQLLADAYLREGADDVGAEKALNAVLALDPENARAKQNLHVLRQKRK